MNCLKCDAAMLPYGTYQGVERHRCVACGQTNAPGHYLSREKFMRLIDAFRRGLSGRAAGRAAGVAKMTAWKIRREIDDRTLCECGDPAGHRGWCWSRYRSSPARQEAMARFGVLGRTGRKANPWKFKPVVHQKAWPFLPAVGRDETSLTVLIDACVPKALPSQIREEVCQDIAVACLEGRVELADVESRAREFIAAVFKQFPTNWGPLSLDAPLRGYDGLTLGDSIAAKEIESGDQ